MVHALLVLGFAALAGTVTAFRGIRASDDELRGMAKVIGTRNPKLARIVCWVAFVPLSLVGVGLVGGWFVLVGSALLRELGW
jgi:hypothetical protein